MGKMKDPDWKRFAGGLVGVALPLQRCLGDGCGGKNTNSSVFMSIKGSQASITCNAALAASRESWYIACTSRAPLAAIVFDIMQQLCQETGKRLKAV
jgi:hypothetical protein